MRLIDADAIDYRNDRLHDVSDDFIKGIEYANDCINNAPTIEPKRGKWILSSDGNGYIGNPVYKCTVCGWWDEQVPYNFCPNCGADMRKESE